MEAVQEILVDLHRLGHVLGILLNQILPRLQILLHIHQRHLHLANLGPGGLHLFEKRLGSRLCQDNVVVLVRLVPAHAAHHFGARHTHLKHPLAVLVAHARSLGHLLLLPQAGPLQPHVSVP